MTMTRLLIAIALLFPVVAIAQDAGVPALVAETSTTTTTTTTTAADKLHDPASSPAQALDDVKQLKRQGWAVFAFGIGAMAAKLLGRVRKYPWLAWLAKGRVAIVVGALCALLTAGYNALAEGGSVGAALMAGVVAVATYWRPAHGADASA